MPWVKVSLVVSQDKLEFVEALLFEHDAQSITVSSATEETCLEHTLHALPQWSVVRVEVLFSSHENIPAVLMEVKTVGIDVLEVSFVGDDEWQLNGDQEFEPMDFGGLWVVARHEPTRTDNIMQVRLEPGLAFGTGRHPTTSMCLSWLATHRPEHLNVLDFGTGSGILAIAAKKLGAQSVDAIDLDSLAQETARENARHNEVEIFVSAHIPLRKRYDLIIANIVANTIIQFAPILTKVLNPNGEILLTGLLSGQVGRVKASYTDITFEDSIQREDWHLLIGTKNLNRQVKEH